MKSSPERLRATSVNQVRIHRCPNTSTTESRMIAFTPAIPNVAASSPAGRESAGITISSGTTAMSWNSNTPIASRP